MLGSRSLREAIYMHWKIQSMEGSQLVILVELVVDIPEYRQRLQKLNLLKPGGSGLFLPLTAPAEVQSRTVGGSYSWTRSCQIWIQVGDPSLGWECQLPLGGRMIKDSLDGRRFAVPNEMWTFEGGQRLHIGNFKKPHLWRRGFRYCDVAIE